MDIGPFNYYDSKLFSYTERTQQMLEELNSLDLSNTNRNQLREKLTAITGGSKMLADFFMMGIQEISAEMGNFKWQQNLPVICKSYENILRYTPEHKQSEWLGKMKVFVGRTSRYIIPERLHEFGNYYPSFNHHGDVVWFDSGHWIHYEKPTEFLKEFHHFNQTLND